MRRSKKLRAGLLRLGLLIVGACSAARAAPITVSLSPPVDSFVASALPDNSFGLGGAMCVAASGASTGEFQSLFRFDTASASTTFNAAFGPGNWTVQSVRLQLYADDLSNTIFPSPRAGQFVASWMQNDLWPEGTGTASSPGTGGVTFNTLSSYLTSSDQALGVFTYDGAIGNARLYSLDLTPGLLADVYAGGPISLRLSPMDSDISFHFHSEEYKNPTSARPFLHITAVPEPASLCLLATGAAVLTAGLMVRGARRSRRD